MNMEEIDYWLRYFSNHNQSFMSKDGKIITLFKVFQELKELQYLLKIKNDYINELQQENQELKKENKILRENAEHNDKVVDKVNWENQKLKKQLEENKNPLKGIFAQVNDDTLLRDCGNMNAEIKELKNKQKDFTEWLTNETNINPYDISDYTYEDIINTILSKYNEIIGSDSK